MALLGLRGDGDDDDACVTTKVLALPHFLLAEAGAAGPVITTWINRGWCIGFGYVSNHLRLVIIQPCAAVPPRAYSLCGLFGQMPKAVTRGCAVPCDEVGNDT